jgi:hypothetical protein
MLVANYNSDSDAEPEEEPEEGLGATDQPADVGSGLAALPAPKKKKVVAFHLHYNRAALTRKAAVRKARHTQRDGLGKASLTWGTRPIRSWRRMRERLRDTSGTNKRRKVYR